MSDFKYHGNWFLKEGKAYPGELAINSLNGDILLEIYSSETLEGRPNSIQANPAEYFHEFIFGDGFGGPFTLYNCHLKIVSEIGGNVYKSAYRIEYLIHGVQADLSLGLMIKSGTFSFPGLADWYDGWKHSEYLDKVEGKLTDLHLSKLETLKINDELELVFYDHIDSRIEQINFSYRIAYRKTLKFSYSTDVPFNRLLKDSVTFLKLLEFSNSKPLNRQLFELEISHTQISKKPSLHYGARDTVGYSVSNFSLSKNEEVPPHGSASVHMIFDHDKLGGKDALNQLIIKWFNHQQFSNIVEYYLDANNWFQGSKDAVLSNVMFNNRFLNLIQGLEDYYREKLYQNNNEILFNQQKGAVLKMVTDPQLKQWINNKFKFTSYLSLTEKLKIILTECMPVISAIYGPVSFDNFPKSASEFRNILSHGMNKDINLGEKLHLHYQIARFLVLICILKSLEITDFKRLLHLHFKLGRDMQQIIRLQQVYPD